MSDTVVSIRVDYDLARDDRILATEQDKTRLSFVRETLMEKVQHERELKACSEYPTWEKGVHDAS